MSERTCFSSSFRCLGSREIQPGQVTWRQPSWSSVGLLLFENRDACWLISLDLNPSIDHHPAPSKTTLPEFSPQWTGVCSPGIVFGAVSADDLDARMLPGPFCQRFTCPIGQKIDWPVRFQVQQKRPIRMPATKGKVVSARHSWRGRRNH